MAADAQKGRINPGISISTFGLDGSRTALGIPVPVARTDRDKGASYLK